MKTREFLKSIAAFLALLMSQTTEGYCSPEWMAQASEGAALPAEAERAIGNLDFNSNDLTLSSTNLSTSLADMLDGLNGVRVDENNLEFRIIFESDILFDFDKANIRESALPTLKIAAGALEQFRGKKN